MVRKMARQLQSGATGRRRWQVDLEGLSLGSYAGGAGVKSFKIGSGSKKKSRSVGSYTTGGPWEHAGFPESTCPNWYTPPGSDPESGSCMCPGRVHGGNRKMGSTVGLAPHSMNMQVVQPRTTSYVRDDGVQVDVLEGTDIVGPINLETVKNTGDVLLEAFISPAALHNTRLAQLAPLYQRYRFLEIEFIYQPIANATQSGQVIGFCTFDPDSPLAAEDALNLNKAAAFYGNRQNQIWEPASYGQHQPSTMTDLYIDPSGADVRFSYQGIFYLIAAGELSSSGSLALGQIGTIYMRYKVELYIPQLQSGVGSIAASKYTFLSDCTSGVLAPFGDGQIIPLGTSNSVTVQGVDSHTIRILGLTGGSFVALAAGASLAGASGSASQTGGTGTVVGGTIVLANSAFVLFNSNNASWNQIMYIQVDASVTQIEVSYTATLGSSYNATDDTGLLMVTTFPPSVSELFAARRRRDRQVSELISMYSSIWPDGKDLLKGAGPVAKPVGKAAASTSGETGRPDLAQLIRRQADASRL